MSNTTRQGFHPTLNTSGVIEPRTVVTLSASNTVVQATANTDEVIGVTLNDGAIPSGDVVGVVMGGIAVATAGGTVAFGAKLTATTGGKLIATTTATHKICAIAMEAGVDGDRIDVKMITPVLYSALA